MKTIWKFPLRLENTQRIEMPKNASVLCVQVQGEDPCMWALVDVAEATLTEMRIFEIYGTGHAIPDEKGKARPYVATFQQPPFVWHVFEVIREVDS